MVTHAETSACNLICLFFAHSPFFVFVLSCVLVINNRTSFHSFTFNILLLALGAAESTPINLEGLTSYNFRFPNVLVIGLFFKA